MPTVQLWRERERTEGWFEAERFCSPHAGEALAASLVVRLDDEQPQARRVAQRRLPAAQRPQRAVQRAEAQHIALAKASQSRVRPCDREVCDGG
eukprot:1837844-Prymnesium_polylepis.2